ncbi:HvfC/BufC family peptide modification chaperone [Luteibacter sp.]|uniref:HvfC/BufC family peptide modification chaperone n=1 Tax=Luteibacter sp. TaxID=1886636 RepID=UPI003F7CFECE
MRPASSLAELQREFQAGLLAEEPAVRVARHAGFSIHRHTMLRAAIDALEANFPAVACLTGAAWFRSAAAAYAHAYPARDARLAVYGSCFPRFLDDMPSACELPYLADVARLDRLWTESYFAGECEPLSAMTVRSLAPDALAGMAVRPHPATRTLESRLPALSIWQASRAGEAVSDDLAWQPQAILVTRPAHTVQLESTDLAVLTFLEACREGGSLVACIEHVASLHPAARADHVFAQLLMAGALVVA